MLSADQRAALQFYANAGVDTVEAESPGGIWNWKAASPRRVPAQQPAPAPQAPAPTASVSAGEALSAAEALAATASDLEMLVSTIAAFEGCPLREGARGPVVYDGVLGADVLIVGEAPGREEDRLGKPFVGRSGQLLDRMLASIGLARAPGEEQRPVCITNVVYWRPPGNRNPTSAELAVCMPFARRFIALTKPKLVLLAGKVPTEAFFPDVSSIIRSRGQWREIETPDGAVPALPIFHPAFLLRQPAQKRWAWRDLLSAKAKLNDPLP
ncbi:MAG: uracil-DNA glycosylase [Pseudomonadota bacterium]